VFSKFNLHYDFLEEWACITGIKYEMFFDDKKELTKQSINYSFPDEVSATLDEMIISLSYSFSSDGDRIKRPPFRILHILN